MTERIILPLHEYLDREAEIMRSNMATTKHHKMPPWTVVEALVESYCAVLKIMAQQERHKGMIDVENKG